MAKVIGEHTETQNISAKFESVSEKSQIFVLNSEN